MVVSETAETEYERDIGTSSDKVMEALKVYVSISVACTSPHGETEKPN